MSSKKLTLTEDEQGFLNTLLERQGYVIAGQPEKERKSKANQITLKLANKILLAPEVDIDRNEVRILQKLVDGYIKRSELQTIPEYHARIAKYPEQRERYMVYLAKEQDNLEKNRTLLEKIEGLL